jgi:phage gp36-like protein
MYGSIQGVKDNLPRFEKSIKPDNLATGNLDIRESTVTTFLKEFTALVDTALSTSYLIPIKDQTGATPELINTIVNNLAAYKLSSRFHQSVGNDENFTISSLRKDANDILKNLVAGEYSLLGVARAGAISTGDSELDELLLEADEDVYFTMEDPEHWQIKL